MATKTASKKKTTTTTKAAKTTTSSAKKPAAAAKKASRMPGVLCERDNSAETILKKYRFFFVFFGITTVLFAATSVWLFVFSSKVLERWTLLDSCARNGESCQVVIRSETAPEETTDDIVEE